MRTLRFCLALMATVVLQAQLARAAERVDLMLALAMDVSRSMDDQKFLLQRQGYSAAISDPRVLNAIKSGPYQKIAICFIDWSAPYEQRLIIDWSTIDGPAAATHFADLIGRAPRSFFNSTSIAGAIDFASAQMAKAPFEADRRAIDVSGDGTNNSGRDVQAARDDAVRKGITINGLAILTDIQLSRNPQHTNPPGGLEKYYREHVASGPGSFVMVAEDFSSFGQAMVKKLIAEIASGETSRRSAALK
jgi:hypothetical protein